MAGGDDDYGDAFKKAKLEHDQQMEAPTEAKRLQAEADADIAVLSNVVLPQLQAAAQKLHPLGGKVEIRQYGRTGKTLRPASVAFRITDQQDQQDQDDAGGQERHPAGPVDEHPDRNHERRSDEQRHRAQQPHLRVADVQRVLQLRRDGAHRGRVRPAQRQHRGVEEESRCRAWLRSGRQAKR